MSSGAPAATPYHVTIGRSIVFRISRRHQVAATPLPPAGALVRQERYQRADAVASDWS